MALQLTARATDPERTTRSASPGRARRWRGWRRVVAAGVVLAGVVGAVVGGAASAGAVARGIDEAWVLDAIRVPQAWQVTRGAGVTVAVLDTGVDATHPDLAGRVVMGPDYTGEGVGPSAPHWGEHGTEMASLIAGAGAGIQGVAPQARILSVRVILDDDDPRASASPSGGSTAADPVASGIRYAVDHGARVISMSLGTVQADASPDGAQASAVAYALQHGAVVVAAAGNEGARGNTVSYPGAFPGVIAVGAVDREGNVPAFSTRRWYTSVVAPGVGVPGDLPHTTAQYIVADGTSPATALVAGAAALMLSANPDLTPAQVRDLLETTTTAKPPGGFDPASGFGTVNVAAAVHAATTAPAATPLPRADNVPAADGQPSAQAAAAVHHAASHTTAATGAAVTGGAAVLLLATAVALERRRRQGFVPE